MNSKEITDYIMSCIGDRTGFDSIGPAIDGLVEMIAWQQKNINSLEKRIIQLERKNELV